MTGMRRLSIREMRAALGRLDKLMEEEGEVLITRHGHPIARILPVRGARSRPSHAELRARLSPASIPSEALLRQEREER